MKLRPVRGAHAAHPRVKALLGRGVDRDPAVETRVRQILAEVRDGGLQAATRLARELDGLGSRQALRASARDLERAANLCPLEVRTAIERSIANVEAFHREQIEPSWVMQGQAGGMLGLRVQALDRVGLYVPGGHGAYPSTVIMNAVPARVAGVRSITVTTPCPRGLAPALAFALQALGIDEVWRLGGAQAVGLLAHGVRGSDPVDKIVGPANVWASVAKREVLGLVGIDNFAGPSEILVVFDGSVPPGWVAADLLSQAEHGSGLEAAVGLTLHADAARAVAIEMERQIEESPVREVLERCLTRHGALLVARSREDALAIANRLAPEHCQIMTEDPEPWIEGIRHAGAVFVGPWTPESLGDYLAGPNHVLPTSGTARFASPLGVWDFVRRSTILHYGPEALRTEGPHVVALARSEGFFHHAEAIRIRLGGAR